MAEWNPKANDIFVRAVEIGTLAGRQLFLEQQCGGDAALRGQVESLLAAGGKVGSFLEKPAVPAFGATGATAAYPPTSEGAGTAIGPYKLLQQLGEGGMDSAQVIARFEAERQSLALMDHPNIAKVLDAGSTDAGRPYFVMELVKGVPITDYCDERRLGPRERLELFIQVCRAVQHAHQKGIIHRDLKPSNVLVALYDGQPVPKVIDFGVAKAIGQKLTERTLFTEFGALVGTLEYMSPEQAELNQLDIDTRSDVYSLGVLLYELLTGSTPLDRERLKEAVLLEVLRRIREEEPPRPSTRLGTSGGLVTLSAQRGTEPAKLARLVRGELDWIVMKALEKDRNRRYETADRLALDIERHLADQPVEACPPSARYKLKKFTRRHKMGIAVTAAFMLLLVLGVTISTWQAVRAKQQRDLAVYALEQAEDAKKAETKAKETGVEALSGMVPGLRNAVNLLSEANRQRDEALEQKSQAIKEAAELRKEIESLRHSQTDAK